MILTDDNSLEEALSRPTRAVTECLSRLEGDILLLGVAGKMGPSLARMARRACDEAGNRRRVIGVSRFREPGVPDYLKQHGIEVIPCDLLDERAVDALPDVANVIFMAGMKFGTGGNEPLSWAMNTHLPALVCQKFRRSRIAAFSTGNVYGLRQVAAGGSRETDKPNPVGEYAMSCLGRERMFEHFSLALGIPVVLLRLNYACDLRYGVLVDLAVKIWRGEAIDLGMSWCNTLWQRDANAYTLLSLELATSPASHLNMTGETTLNVREAACALADKLGKQARFTGTETDSALLNDATRCFDLFGKPSVNEEELIKMVATWIKRGGALLGKPTHFESRDGKF